MWRKAWADFTNDFLERNGSPERIDHRSSQFVSRGMCVDFAIHDTDSGNPHCHIMLTMRPLNERGTWTAKSKKEYDLDENGERIRLPSGRYKTHKVDLTGWNSQENALVWRKACSASGIFRL